MNSSGPAEVASVAKSRAASHTISLDEKHDLIIEPSIQETTTRKGLDADANTQSLDKTYPSDEDLRTLRRVAGKVPWSAFTIAFVELCERFSYYGTTAVCTFTHR